MKIAFPTEDSKGMESPVFGHFGSAHFFVVVETDDDSLEILSNQDLEHVHGQCQPISALGGKRADAVVVGGIGGGALRKLQAGGLKVYRAAEGTVRENLDLFKSGKLPEFTMIQTCAGHSHDGGCAHH